MNPIRNKHHRYARSIASQPINLFYQDVQSRSILVVSLHLRATCTEIVAFVDYQDSTVAPDLDAGLVPAEVSPVEAAAAEAGLVFAMVRTNEEFRRELQYTEVLSTMPLIRLEKIGESEPMPFKPGGKSPLDGVRAFGMGHVIAGGAIGRDLAYYGADEGAQKIREQLGLDARLISVGNTQVYVATNAL